MIGTEIRAFRRLLRSFEVRMNLKDLVRDLPGGEILGDGEQEISGLSYDSRLTRKGDLFVAVQGTVSDGNRFAVEAVSKGASAVLTERPINRLPGVPMILVDDARQAKARAAACFYGYPSRRLDCVGVTGTNGKTTVSTMLKSIFEQDGRPAGLIGTIHNLIGKRVVPSTNTTPDPVTLQRYLAEMVDENLEAAVMEVSSHALAQARVDEIDFRIGVFTNLSPEHLDYHETMEAYGKTKQRLFASLPADSLAVINTDDPSGELMASACACPIIRYGFSRKADVRARIRRMDIDGFSMILQTPRGEVDVTSRMIGRFNVMNAMAASAAAIGLGVPLAAIKSGFETLKWIEGRMESVDCGQDFRVIVDYAHTSDALGNLLSNLKPLTVGKLIVVFGCGGDRDNAKRPLMGEAATTFADHVIITSDNPRTEDPERIINHILKGVTDSASYEVESDREQAISRAIDMASGGDIVVIAGKGHEDYQILNKETIAFDDRRVAEKVLWTRYH